MRLAARRMGAAEWVAATAALAILAACLLVASRQWFWGDDFPYLAQARADAWSWRDAFLPRRPGFNWAYRPLSLETFFYFGNLVFGLRPFGFLAVSFLFHSASGALLWALALRLGLHRSASAFAALLSVSRLPSLSEVFHISIFTYVLSKFLMLASVLLALVALRRERQGARVAFLAASVVATGLAFLASEFALVTPGIVAAALVCDGRLRSQRVPWSRIAGQLLPHFLVAAAWCVVRFELVVLPPRPSLYGPSFGLHTLHNAAFLFGSALGSGASSVLVLWLLVPVAAVAAQPVLRARVGEWPFCAVLVSLAWLGGAAAVFAPVTFPQLRFAIGAEAPVSLLVGIGASLAWRCAPPRASALLGAAAVLSLVVTIPHGALWKNFSSPRGDEARVLIELVERDPARRGVRIVLLHSGQGMASVDAASRYLYAVWYGAAFPVVDPGWHVLLEVRDASRPPHIGDCPSCVYVAVRPDLSLEVVPDPAATADSLP